MHLKFRSIVVPVFMRLQPLNLVFPFYIVTERFTKKFLSDLLDMLPILPKGFLLSYVSCIRPGWWRRVHQHFCFHSLLLRHASEKRSPGCCNWDYSFLVPLLSSPVHHFAEYLVLLYYRFELGNIFLYLDWSQTQLKTSPYIFATHVPLNLSWPFTFPCRGVDKTYPSFRSCLGKLNETFYLSYLNSLHPDGLEVPLAWGPASP